MTMILQRKENERPLRVVILLLVLVLLLVEVDSATTSMQAKRWKLEEFPKDSMSEICRSEEGRVCDPDGFLNVEELRQLEDAILKLEQTELSLDIPCSDNNDENASKHVKIAIAIVQQVSFSLLEGDEPKSCQLFV